MTELHDFYWETKTLYLSFSRETATSNAWDRREVNFDKSFNF